jgi:hypothetical protein
MYCTLNSRLTEYGEKNILGNLGTFRVLIVLCLTLGIFTNSVMAETCFCGEACSHAFQKNIMKKMSFPFHNHCVGTHCKSCNFEDGQTLKAANSFPTTGNLETFDTSFILFTGTDYHSNNHIINGFCLRIYTGIKVQSSPAYLQNLSLIL